MKKVVIIYWSSTGNTETLANAIADGASEAGAEVKLMPVDEASVEDAVEADVLALGCPATGNEELEDAEMLPFVESLEDKLADKPLVLFGSYDWGDGEWMENWAEQMRDYGVKMLEEPMIVNLEPEDEDLEAAKELGAKLAK